jgi:hypothetical protein
LIPITILLILFFFLKSVCPIALKIHSKIQINAGLASINAPLV